MVDVAEYFGEVGENFTKFVKWKIRAIDINREARAVRGTVDPRIWHLMTRVLKH